MPRSNRQRGSQATRVALRAAGAKLFARNGFDGTTVEQIARAAGVNRALISYHFRGKAGLYDAILRATFEPLLARLQAMRASTPQPDQALRAFVLVLREFAGSHPEFPAMMLREAMAGGRRAPAVPLTYPLEILALVRGILEQGMREGVFRNVDPVATHVSMIGSVIFFFATAPVRQRLVKGRRVQLYMPTEDEYIEHITELFRRGLAGATPVGAGQGG